MKLLSSLIVFLSCAVIAKAQTDQILPVDERGKLIYYEVVEAKASPTSLQLKAINYLKKQNKDLKYKSIMGDSGVIATGKMVIHKTVLVVSHPSGEILYSFEVEVKGNRYRFWLTDFSFIPYQRDRYGNFVAATTIGIPLERDPGKLNTAQWKEYQVQTTKYAKDLAADFKRYMANETLIKPVKEKTVVKKEWR